MNAAPVGYRGNSTLPIPKEERTMLRVQGGGAASAAGQTEKSVDSYTGNTILVGNTYRVRMPNQSVLKDIMELHFTSSEKELFESLGFNKKAIRNAIQAFPKDSETNQFAIFWKNYVMNDCKYVSRFYTKKECYALQTFLRSIQEIYHSYAIDVALQELLDSTASEGVKGGLEAAATTAATTGTTAGTTAGATAATAGTTAGTAAAAAPPAATKSSTTVAPRRSPKRLKGGSLQTNHRIYTRRRNRSHGTKERNSQPRSRCAPDNVQAKHEK